MTEHGQVSDSDAGSGRSLLSVRDLVVSYDSGRRFGRRARQPKLNAVDGVSLELSSGEMLAFVGESGSGKTTSGLAVLRMVATASGEVWFDGNDLTTLSQRELRPFRRHIQMIYQDPYESLNPRMKVRTIIEESLIVHRLGGSKAQRALAVRESLEQVGLTPPDLFLDRYPHELSGGQRQRVAIAAALVLKPSLLIADEPVSMLDMSVRAGILALFDELRTNLKLGVLMITHDLGTVAQFADRIAVMYLGRVVEEGGCMDVIERPLHPYTRALVAAASGPSDDAVGEDVLQGAVDGRARAATGCRFAWRCPMAETRCEMTEQVLIGGVDKVAQTHRVACVLAAESESVGA